jgi:hypothetical protein
MSRITRESFIDSFGAQGQGGLDLTSLGDAAKGVLEKAGLGPDALGGIAGADHVISSRDELSALFDLIDRVDANGSSSSFDTTKMTADGKILPSLSGEVFDALQNKLAAARLGADKAVAQGDDPPKMPSPAEIKKSEAAIGAGGFTDVHLVPTPYLNQGDKSYAQFAYPKSPPEPGAIRTLGQAGCGPCSLAIADSGLRGSSLSAKVTASFTVQHKLSGSPTSTGTDTAGMARAWSEHRGFALTEAASKDQSKNVDVLKAGLEAGGVALVSVGVDAATGRGHFTEGGHVLVINGCAMKDGQEWFAIVNPGRRDQSKPHEKLLSVDDNVVQVDGAVNGVGNVWISRQQLEAEMRRCCVLQSGAVS